MPPLTTPNGTPIGAVYGFANMLYKFISNNQSDLIAVILDSGQKNFRHEMYKEYKANRPEAPDDLVIQFPIIRDVIEAFNVVSLEKPGYEADDLIATYAKHGKSQGLDVQIVSSDKDLMQLVDDKVSMYDAMKDRKITYDEVVEKFSVKPSQVLDLLSLIGDSSDNVPGVRGIGLKTAAELINEFNTLDGIYENLENIKQARRKQLLIEGKDNAYLSKSLITLDDKMELVKPIDELKVKELDKEKLAEFLTEMGFKALLAKVGVSANVKQTKSEPAAAKKISIESLAELDSHITKIKDASQVAVLNMGEELQISYEEKLLCIKFSESVKQDSLFDDNAASGMTFEDIAHKLKDVLEDRSIKKIILDAKTFIKNMKVLGVKIKAFDDVAVMSYALDTGKHKYTLNDLVQNYLDDNSEPSAASLIQLHKVIFHLLVQNKILSVYEKLDKPMIMSLADLEGRGVKVDLQFLSKLSEEFKLKIFGITQEIYKLSGREFNIGSPKQLGEVLFDELGIKVEGKTKRSTGAEVLEALAEQGHEIANLVLQWRQYSKLVNTYIDALPKHVNSKSGRVHTNFLMTATSTGRLSSIDPNLQNIPIRTEEGQRIRQAFIAEKGKVIISADYSQIELRLLAHTANVGQLKNAFMNNQDVHAITASQMFGVDLDKVDSNLRRQAKTINFGIIYGISGFGLAKRLGISRDAAKKYIEEYFVQYPGIKEYMDSSIEYARIHGYVKTHFGRRCYVNGINDKNFNLRGVAERAAINAPLQGTAADIIKKAMISLPQDVSKYMILQIHDELLFEVPEEKANELCKKIKNVMEGAASLDITMSVDVNYGESWAEAH
jgi:DNA polymerase-1